MNEKEMSENQSVIDQGNHEEPTPEVVKPIEEPSTTSAQGEEKLEKTDSLFTEDSQKKPEKKPEKKAKKQPPTRFQSLLRKILIGLAIVIVIFLAGVLTDHFTRYKPLSDQLNETQATLESVNQELDALTAENAQLVRENQTLSDEIADLEEALSAAQANALFYQVLVEVNSARIALFVEDTEGALVALEDTQDNLETLLPVITDIDPDLALSLPRRLELIVSGLTRDPETGRIDLELFTKDLLALEPQLGED